MESVLQICSMSSFTLINANEFAVPQQSQQRPAQQPQSSVLSIDDDDKPAAAIPCSNINNSAYFHPQPLDG